MKPFEIFRVGTHTANSGATLTFSAADLAAVAAGYDPDMHEAPLVVGHPRMDGPAYGWVKSLEFREGALLAAADDLAPEFEDLVQAGRYKKVSAAFYTQRDPGNPTPGRMYLRHVGFLGAVPPAVKGLKPVEFSDDGSGLLVFGERDTSSRERTLAEREANIRRRETEMAVDQLINEGRLIPRLRTRVLAFCDILSDNVTLEFSEDDETVSLGSREAFLEYLKLCPTVVTFGEIATKENDPFEHGGKGGGNLPKGYAVDRDAADLHARAMAHQLKYGGSYREAVLAVSGG